MKEMLTHLIKIFIHALQFLLFTLILEEDIYFNNFYYLLVLEDDFVFI